MEKKAGRHKLKKPKQDKSEQKRAEQNKKKIENNAVQHGE